MTNGNDSAYPFEQELQIQENGIGEYGVTEPFMKTIHIQSQGLTKREKFAAMAMQGLLSGRTEYEDNSNSEGYAEIAVRHADALIEQLNKTSY